MSLGRRTFFGALLLLVAGCGSGGPGGGTPPGGGGSTAGTIQASTGGVVEAGGAKLTIPPGALSQDAKVTLDVGAKPTEPKSNPMQPVGPAVNVDLGGATLKVPATLELPVTDTSTDGTAVVLETRPSNADGEPLLWVHAARPAAVSGALETGPAAAQSLPGRVRYDLQRAGLYVVHVVPKPSPTELAGATSLEVPFYYQAGLPWCVPTSLAMSLNYFKPLPAMSGNPRFPGGFVSNFGLASLIKQSPSSGAGVLDILNAAGVPADAYRFMRWDAELIPSDGKPSDGAYNAFVAYVALATTGAFGLGTPQPVWTSSDREWHAFVLTGVTSDGLYMDDGNARPASDWAGTHPVVTLKAFREATCALKDKDDPSKGCSDSAPNPDLYTVTWASDPRPETERRGSIELSHGGTIYFSGIPVVFEPSLSFRNPSGLEISRWEWDGAYPNGYYFSDEATTVNTFPYANNLVQDTQFQHLIYRSSRMLVQFNVNDVTNVALDYDVDARVTIGGVTKSQKFSTVHVGAYDATEVDLDFGNLADLIGPITAPTAAQLEINLQQAGALQDVKQIAFRLAPDPSDQPQVRILVPSVPTTLLKGEPFTFVGEGFDAHTLPDGRAQLSWWQGATKLASVGQFNYVPTAAGTATLVLLATGEYGAQVSSSVTVNVIDPTRTPGEIVIVSPQNNQSFWSPTINQALVSVPLVGYATYSNGVPVPGDRLVWSAQAQGSPEHQVGRGSSLTVQLVGGQDTALRYTIRMDVMSEGTIVDGGYVDGPPIGSANVSITVGYTHIG